MVLVSRAMRVSGATRQGRKFWVTAQRTERTYVCAVTQTLSLGRRRSDFGAGLERVAAGEDPGQERRHHVGRHDGRADQGP